MSASPAISALIFTRNRADVAHECVLASSRIDFEVVVRDNCSTDNMRELLNTIRDDRLSVYRAPENQGMLTFYEASKLARMDIVAWLSDEDGCQPAELDFILEQFRQELMFGGVIVGAKTRELLVACVFEFGKARLHRHQPIKLLCHHSRSTPCQSVPSLVNKSVCP